jgi:hypothetical protein
MGLKPAPDFNRARMSGRLTNLRQRWTPDGSMALIAELVTTRPQLGPVRAGVQDEQPMPLRAEGDIAGTLAAMEEQHVMVEGCLRRRYYSRDGEPCWGQVEIWVDQCRSTEASQDTKAATGQTGNPKAR